MRSLNASSRDGAAEGEGAGAPLRARTKMTNHALRRGIVVSLLFWITLLVVPDESFAAPPQASDTPQDFEALMNAFQKMEGFEARFEETKTLALLIAPLRSSGRLYYAKPSVLLRRVERPRPTDIVITKERIRIRDGSKEQVVDLASHSEARPLVESMLWLFAGDAAALEAEFDLDYRLLTRVDTRDEATAGEGAGRGKSGLEWELRMVPKSASIHKLVKEIRMSGTGSVARLIEMTEPGGDRTLTRIFDSNPDRHFDSEERRVLFGPPES